MGEKITSFPLGALPWAAVGEFRKLEGTLVKDQEVSSGETPSRRVKRGAIKRVASGTAEMGDRWRIEDAQLPI